MFLGTPLRKDEDSKLSLSTTVAYNDSRGNTKNAILVKRPDGSVAKARGEAVFHGAFTGGFTAGYHGTVGSKQGFQPAAFVSKRKRGRQEEKEEGRGGAHSVAGLLDDEDRAAGIVAPEETQGLGLGGGEPPRSSEGLFTGGGAGKAAARQFKTDGDLLLEELFTGGGAGKASVAERGVRMRLLRGVCGGPTVDHNGAQDKSAVPVVRAGVRPPPPAAPGEKSSADQQSTAKKRRIVSYDDSSSDSDEQDATGRSGKPQPKRSQLHPPTSFGPQPQHAEPQHPLASALLRPKNALTGGEGGPPAPTFNRNVLLKPPSSSTTGTTTTTTTRGIGVNKLSGAGTTTPSPDDIVSENLRLPETVHFTPPPKNLEDLFRPKNDRHGVGYVQIAAESLRHNRAAFLMAGGGEEEAGGVFDGDLDLGKDDREEYDFALEDEDEAGQQGRMHPSKLRMIGGGASRQLADGREQSDAGPHNRLRDKEQNALSTRGGGVLVDAGAEEEEDGALSFVDGGLLADFHTQAKKKFGKYMFNPHDDIGKTSGFDKGAPLLEEADLALENLLRTFFAKFDVQDAAERAQLLNDKEHRGFSIPNNRSSRGRSSRSRGSSPGLRNKEDDFPYPTAVGHNSRPGGRPGFANVGDPALLARAQALFGASSLTFTKSTAVLESEDKAGLVSVAELRNEEREKGGGPPGAGEENVPPVVGGGGEEKAVDGGTSSVRGTGTGASTADGGGAASSSAVVVPSSSVNAVEGGKAEEYRLKKQAQTVRSDIRYTFWRSHREKRGHKTTDSRSTLTLEEIALFEQVYQLDEKAVRKFGDQAVMSGEIDFFGAFSSGPQGGGMGNMARPTMTNLNLPPGTLRYNFRPHTLVLKKLSLEDPWKGRRFVDNRPDGGLAGRAGAGNAAGGVVGMIGGRGGQGLLTAGLPTAGERAIGGGGVPDGQQGSLGISWGEQDLPPVLRNFLALMTVEGGAVDPTLMGMVFG